MLPALTAGGANLEQTSLTAGTKVRAVKIIMVVGKSTGGIGAHVGALTKSLRARGHQVRICTDALTAKHFDYDAVDLLWPVFPRSWYSLKLVYRRMRRARKVLRSAEVVHAHGYQAGFYASYLLGRVWSAPPLALSLHNALAEYFPAPLSQLLRRVLFSRCQLVTGSSSDLVEAASRAGADQVRLDPIPSPKIRRYLEHDALDRRRRLDNWKKLALKEHIDNRGQLVLAVGRIEADRQYDLLLKAMDYLGYPASAVVIGGGDTNLLTELRSVGNEAKVSFLGGRSNLDEWFAAATVLVVTSKWEARSLVVQEAMAHGLPVIAPAVGGLVDLLGPTSQEGNAGLLFAPGDPADLGNAMGQLLSEPGTWYEFQKRGRQRAAHWPSIGELSQQWEMQYQALCQNKTRKWKKQ